MAVTRGTKNGCWFALAVAAASAQLAQATLLSKADSDEKRVFNLPADDAELEEVVASGKAVVQFCKRESAACSKIEDKFAAYAAANPDIVSVKAVVETHGASVKKYNIANSPVFLSFDQGHPVAGFSGASPELLKHTYSYTRYFSTDLNLEADWYPITGKVPTGTTLDLPALAPRVTDEKALLGSISSKGPKVVFFCEKGNAGCGAWDVAKVKNLVETHKDKVEAMMVDVLDMPAVGKQYHVTGTPVYLLFNGSPGPVAGYAGADFATLRETFEEGARQAEGKGAAMEQL